MKTPCTILLIYFSVCFTSCTSRDEKLRMLSKRWVYSEKTYEEKLSNLSELEKNGNNSEKISAHYLKQRYKNLGKVVIEFESTGNFIQGFSINSALARFYTSNGKWETDEDLKKITIISNKTGIENYTIKELSENSLKLSYYKNGEETVNSYVPFTEETLSDNSSQVEKNTQKQTVDIVVQPFYHKNDLSFGYLIKQNSSSENCVFYSNTKYENVDTQMKINGKIIKFQLLHTTEINDQSFYQEYKSEDYSLRIDYHKLNDTPIAEDEYKVVYSANIKISNFEKSITLNDLYAEALSD